VLVLADQHNFSASRTEFMPDILHPAIVFSLYAAPVVYIGAATFIGFDHSFFGIFFSAIILVILYKFAGHLINRGGSDDYFFTMSSFVTLFLVVGSLCASHHVPARTLATIDGKNVYIAKKVAISPWRHDQSMEYVPKRSSAQHATDGEYKVLMWFSLRNPETLTSEQWDFWKELQDTGPYLNGISIVANRTPEAVATEISADFNAAFPFITHDVRVIRTQSAQATNR